MLERLDVRALAKKCQVVGALNAKSKAEIALRSLGARLRVKADGTGRDNDHIFSVMFE